MIVAWRSNEPWTESQVLERESLTKCQRARGGCGGRIYDSTACPTLDFLPSALDPESWQHGQRCPPSRHLSSRYQPSYKGCSCIDSRGLSGLVQQTTEHSGKTADDSKDR